MDAELYAAFCTLVAYRMAPYGSSTARDLATLLKEPKLDSDNDRLLAGFLDQQSANPVPMRCVGWQGGAIGSRAQIFSANGLLLDPSLALISPTSLGDLRANKPVNTVTVFSHNENQKYYRVRRKTPPFRAGI